jgi:hypothetical protein
MAISQRNGDKSYQVSELIRELERQYPVWPSTFSTCSCERQMARGGGRCSICIEEKLAELIGKPLAWELNNTLKDYIARKCEAIRGKDE